MPSNRKKFDIKLELREFIEDDDALSAIPIFKNSEMCRGIDDILNTFDIYRKRLELFIESKLNNNGEN